MSDPSWARMATKTASAKRATLTNGLSGAPAPLYPHLQCTPLESVSAETQTRLNLGSGFEILQTSFETVDLRKGDILTIDGIDYAIRAVETYEWKDTGFVRVVVEKMVRI